MPCVCVCVQVCACLVFPTVTLTQGSVTSDRGDEMLVGFLCVWVCVSGQMSTVPGHRYLATKKEGSKNTEHTCKQPPPYLSLSLFSLSLPLSLIFSCSLLPPQSLSLPSFLSLLSISLSRPSEVEMPNHLSLIAMVTSLYRSLRYIYICACAM